MGAGTRLAALASVALLSACAGDGSVSTPQPDPTLAQTAAAAPRSTPSARPDPGPPTSIPEHIGLPHQWTWRDANDAARRPLFDFCLDPGPALRPPDTTDYRGRSETTRRASRTESLGV